MVSASRPVRWEAIERPRRSSAPSGASRSAADRTEYAAAQACARSASRPLARFRGGVRDVPVAAEVFIRLVRRREDILASSLQDSLGLARSTRKFARLQGSGQPRHGEPNPSFCRDEVQDKANPESGTEKLKRR